MCECVCVCMYIWVFVYVSVYIYVRNPEPVLWEVKAAGESQDKEGLPQKLEKLSLPRSSVSSNVASQGYIARSNLKEKKRKYGKEGRKGDFYMKICVPRAAQ